MTNTCGVTLVSYDGEPGVYGVLGSGRTYDGVIRLEAATANRREDIPESRAADQPNIPDWIRTRCGAAEEPNAWDGLILSPLNFLPSGGTA